MTIQSRIEKRIDSLADELIGNPLNITAYKYFNTGFYFASAEYEKIIADAINTVKSWYPVDVFPEDGQSIDSKCAKMARKTCENILAEIQKLKEFRG